MHRAEASTMPDGWPSLRADMARAGVLIWPDGDGFGYSAPAGALAWGLRDRLAGMRGELLAAVAEQGAARVLGGMGEEGDVPWRLFESDPWGYVEQVQTLGTRGTGP
jgi:hypothetical protein